MLIEQNIGMSSKEFRLFFKDGLSEDVKSKIILKSIFIFFDADKSVITIRLKKKSGKVVFVDWTFKDFRIWLKNKCHDLDNASINDIYLYQIELINKSIC
jgi:hypothetical protein